MSHPGFALPSADRPCRLNFIYNQNPNGGSNPNWPAYHEAGNSANMLNISNTNTSYSLEIIQDDLRKEQIAYINAHPSAFGL